ncbi:MAG: response regulator [Anaerolineales bacterium]|jgi:DNA-binding NarL/FixJ family response regulator
MRQIKILVVDDHPEVLKQVETRLSYEKEFDVYKVASLSNVEEGVAECLPEILLIDPYNNGFDFDCIRLAKRIRPSLTVIVLTAVVDISSHNDLRRAGADHILEKCIDSDELVSTLRKVVVSKE